MPKNENSDYRPIANEIEIYLSDHPHAADTVDGIATWWLLGQRFDVSNDMVQKALDYLVAAAIVEVRANPSGNKVYGGNRNRH